MQKKKGKYKKNTFDGPSSKYINVNNRYELVDVRFGEQMPMQSNLELILEQKEILQPQLLLDVSQCDLL